MIRVYIKYGLVLLFILALVAWGAYTLFRRIRIWLLRRLLPYSDIVEEVENLNQYYSRGYVDSYIMQYFREGDNLARAKAGHAASRKK